MSIELVMPSHHLIPLSAPSPPASVFPSIMVFSSESALVIRWPKYCTFSISISPSSDRVDFLQDWLIWSCSPRDSKSLIQHHSLKSSILWCSAFIMVQLSYPYMTTGKTIALTIWTFVSVMPSKSIHIAANDNFFFFFYGWVVLHCGCVYMYEASQVVLVIKNPLANARNTRDTGLIPGSGRSLG